MLGFITQLVAMYRPMKNKKETKTSPAPGPESRHRTEPNLNLALMPSVSGGFLWPHGGSLS